MVTNGAPRPSAFQWLLGEPLSLRPLNIGSLWEQHALVLRWSFSFFGGKDCISPDLQALFSFLHCKRPFKSPSSLRVPFCREISRWKALPRSLTKMKWRDDHLFRGMAEENGWTVGLSERWSMGRFQWPLGVPCWTFGAFNGLLEHIQGFFLVSEVCRWCGSLCGWQYCTYDVVS